MPTAVSEAVLRIVGQGESEVDSAVTAAQLGSLRLKPRSKLASALAVAELQLPTTTESLQNAANSLGSVARPWRLMILAHGEENGVHAAGVTGERLALYVSSILNKMQKADLLEIELLVCFAGKQQGANGLAGAFVSYLYNVCRYDALVIAYTHRVSINTQGEVFNPTGMNILHVTPPHKAKPWQFHMELVQQGSAPPQSQLTAEPHGFVPHNWAPPQAAAAASAGPSASAAPTASSSASSSSASSSSAKSSSSSKSSS